MDESKEIMYNIFIPYNKTYDTDNFRLFIMLS
jgi:hypothetical protein